MSTEIAALGLRMDGVSNVDRARDALGRFTKSAEDAEKAADKAADGVKKLDDTSKKASGSSNNLATALGVARAAMGALAAAYGALKLGDFIKDSTLLSARYETMGVVMRIAGNNAGYANAEMEQFSKSLQKQGISMLQSRNSLTQLATANIDLAKASQLARAAQDLAVVGNINSSEALGRMIHGIKAGEIEVLRTMGLNVNFENSYKKLAATLGITTEALTDNQKTQARVQVVLEGATRYNGIYEESLTTASKAMASLTRYWEDFKVKVGDHFLPLFAAAVFGVTDALVALNKAMDVTAGGTSTLTGLLGTGLKLAFEAIVVIAGEVAFVINAVYREIVGISAQAVALAQLDFKGAADIGRMMKEDAAAARLAMDEFSASILKKNTNAKAGAKMSEAERIAAGKAADEATAAADKKLKQETALAAFTKQFGTDAQKAAAATKEWKDKLGDLWDPKMEAMIGGKGAAAANKAAQKTYVDLITSIKQKIATNEAELFAAGKLTESKKLSIKLDEELESGELKMTAARQRSVRAAIAVLAGQEKEQAAIKRAIALNDERLAQDAEVQAGITEMDRQVTAARLSIDDYSKSLADQIEMTDLETRTIGMNAQARQVLIEQLRIEQDLRKRRDAINNTPFRTDADRDAAMSALNAEGTKAVALAQRKVYVAEWEKTSQMVSQTLSDYIMSGGKDAATYLKRLFSNLILQPSVNYASQAIMQSFGMGSGQGAGGAMGGMPGGGFSDWSTWGSKASGWASDASFKLVTNGFESMGTSMLDLSRTISGVDTYLQSVPGMSGGLGSVAGYAGALYSLSEGKVGAAAGAAIGTYIFPGIGTMIGSMLGGMLDGLDKSGTKHQGAGAIYSQALGVQGGADLYNKATFGMGHRDEYNEVLQSNISGIAKGLGETLDQFAVAFGGKAGFTVSTAFADDSSKDGSWGSLKVIDAMGKALVDWSANSKRDGIPREFADGDEGYKEYLKQVAIDIKAPFMAIDAPRWSKDILKVANDFETLTQALQSIAQYKTVFDGLAKTMVMFADISGETQTRLLYASGGMEAFGTNVSAFYERFYSEEERMQKQRELLMETLAKDSLYIDPFQGDEAAASFRKTVEEAMSSGQIELAARLLSMSATFGTSTEYGQKKIDDFAEATKDAADKAKEAADKIKEAAKEALDIMAGLAEGYAKRMESARTAMDAAGALWDRIDKAQGGSGTGYSRIREQRLWDAMAQADYKQQIELAGELTDLVLSRYEVETENAKKLLDFGRSLRTYVDSLKIGNLSPLTSAQKLAEAARQYADTLTKAQGGDETAQGSLQGISSSYLELARQYYASGDEYTKIFNSVTGSLDALGLSSQTEAQAQLGVATESLQQLQQLQKVLLDSYTKAESDFGVQKDLLQRQVEELMRTADGMEVVRDLLGGLPAAIATQINGYSKLAEGYVALLGGAAGSSTDTGYVSGAMRNIDAATWQIELNNALALLTDPAARAKMQSIFDDVAKMKGIDGSHASGLSYVPYDGYVAEVHEGERIMRKSENREYTANLHAGNRSDYSAATVAEVRMLNAKLERSMDQTERLMNALIRATVESNQEGSKAVVDGVGDAIVRSAYAEKLTEGAKAR